MAAPIVFIHGPWLHAASWLPWIDLVADHGYHAIAPGWPGEAETVEQSRADPDALAGHGFDDVVAHHAQLIASLVSKPILIGHSFGGLIAQRLLSLNLGVAAIAVDAARIDGELPPPLIALDPEFRALFKTANADQAISLTPEQFQRAFGTALSEQRSRELYDRWSIPAPGRTLYEAAAATVNPSAPTRMSTALPLLLLSGGKDHPVPEVAIRAVLKRYRPTRAITDIVTFPEKAHSLTIDAGWREVADTALAWLRVQGL